MSDLWARIEEQREEIERLNKQVLKLQNHCLGAADLAWWKDDAKELISELADALSRHNGDHSQDDLIARARGAEGDPV